MAEDAGVAHEPEAPAELSYVIGALNGELDKEFAVAERLTTKSRQVFALAGAFFTVIQTVAFNAFLATEVRGYERWVLLSCVAVGVVTLALAAAATARADSPIPGHRIPLWLMTSMLNAIHTGEAKLPPQAERVDPEDLLGRLPDVEEPFDRAWVRWFPPVEPPDVDRLWKGHVLTRERKGAARDDADPTVVTREDAPAFLATYYATLLKSRLRGNEKRRRLYVRARSFATIAVIVTTIELLFSLVARLTG